MSCEVKEIIKEDERILRLTNDTYELLVPLDYGIRIISFKTLDGKNVLGENINVEQVVDGKKWKIRGGHRIWHTPEVFPRTYMPDNNEINYKTKDDQVIITQPVDKETKIQKQLMIEFIDEEVKIKHRLFNRGMWPIETSIWVITIMTTGGTAVVPLSKRTEEYLPTKFISLWPYAQMNDPRLTFCDDHFEVVQDPTITDQFKIGTNNDEGWAKYILENQLFMKKFKTFKNKDYADNNCSFEVFTNDRLLELESLSPIKIINPGDYIEHTEQWLIKNK